MQGGRPPKSLLSCCMEYTSNRKQRTHSVFHHRPPPPPPRPHLFCGFGVRSGRHSLRCKLRTSFDATIATSNNKAASL
jgi:hypothetical protein